MTKKKTADEIREQVIARALALGLSSYAVAKKTDGEVSEDQVAGYLRRRSSMGSGKLQYVLRALGLRVVVDCGE